MAYVYLACISVN